MTPAVLRTLEFDRIIEALASFALTPVGKARMRAEAAADRPRGRGAGARGHDAKRCATSNSTACSRCGPAPGSSAALDALAVEGRPLEALQLRILADFVASIAEAQAAVTRAPGRLPHPAAAGRPPRAVRRRGRGRAPRHRRQRRGARRRQPGAGERSASGCAGSAPSCAPRSSSSPRPRHGEVPAGAGRHEPARPLRADGARRAQGGNSRHRARLLGHRRQPVPRADGHRSRSTTTSWRSKRRRPRRSSASCSS